MNTRRLRTKKHTSYDIQLWLRQTLTTSLHSSKKNLIQTICTGVIHLVVALSAITLFAIHPTCAFSQDSPKDSNAILKRWYFFGDLGTTSSGPAGDIERAMTTAGFNQTSPGFFGPPVAHPFSRTGIGETGFPKTIGIQYSLTPRLAGGFLFAISDIGTTLGYRDPYLFLFIDYGLVTISPTISFLAGDNFRFGVGPALHFAKARKSSLPDEPWKSSTKLGYVVDASAATHLFSIFSVELRAQYRGVGQVEIGPYEATSFNNSAVMPATKVSFDHWFVGVGLAIHV
jgi:hypothetical protein